MSRGFVDLHKAITDRLSSTLIAYQQDMDIFSLHDDRFLLGKVEGLEQALRIIRQEFERTE